MVALSLAQLPGNSGQLVLATGGLDNKIHIYCGERTGKVCSTLWILFFFFLNMISPLTFSFAKMNIVVYLFPVCSCL